MDVNRLWHEILLFLRSQWILGYTSTSTGERVPNSSVSDGCSLVPLIAPEMEPFEGQHFFTGEEENNDTTTKTFVSLAQLQAQQTPKRLLVSYKKSDQTMLDARRRSPVKKILPLCPSR